MIQIFGTTFQIDTNDIVIATIPFISHSKTHIIAIQDM